MPLSLDFCAPSKLYPDFVSHFLPPYPYVLDLYCIDSLPFHSLCYCLLTLHISRPSGVSLQIPLLLSTQISTVRLALAVSVDRIKVV